jgi:lipid II:glycine glycyltransferase (peptidoglycan interpeptide bridge formation enzyme)
MKVRKVNIDEWNDFVNACPTTTFFHTPQWYKIWHEYAGYGYEARLFEFKSGNKVLLPLGWKKRAKGLIKAYMSSPVGTYGCFLVQEFLSKYEIEKLHKYVNDFSSIQIRENPFQKVFPKKFWSKNDFTQIIELDDGFDDIFKNWTKGHSSAYKKGHREGIIVKLASDNEWKEYFEIYLNTFLRWQKPPSNPYNWELFDLIRELDKRQCKLWLAFYKEKIIAGCLCFYHNNHVVYWHGASLKDYFDFRPVHVLQYYIIKDAVDNGYKWYDFNPSGGHEGVAKFKKGFGTELKPANLFIKQPKLLTTLSAINKKIGF